MLAVYLGQAVMRALHMVPSIPLLNSNLYIQQKLNLSSWVSLSQISPEAQKAVVTSEDDDFYQNKGYNLRSVEEAAKDDFKHRRFKRGASTITQQVIKNVFLTRDKSIGRKIEEIVLAWEVEKSIGKDRLLEVYMNTAQFGEGLYGVQGASDFYFHKKPFVLGPKEGAFLAMLLPSPVRDAKSFIDRKLTPYADKTITTLLERMDREGKLVPGQLKEEMAMPLSFEAVVLPTPSPTVTPADPTPVLSPVVTPAF